MTLPTEPIGSIPRPPALQAGIQAAAAGQLSQQELDAPFDDAVDDTLRRFEETGSAVVTDGEQRKPSFATYPVAGLSLAGGDLRVSVEPDVSSGRRREVST
jgi:5-methyltetrahydropteroyltriglutamate--homocysteine methyltransferase